MTADDKAMVGKSALLAWDVSADQEESWRRFLQELSDPRPKGYAESRRSLGISAESVWLVPKPLGGGVAVLCLEAEDPEWALRDLAVSRAPFASWYGAQMRRIFGSDCSDPPRMAGGELLFAWREASDERPQTLRENS